MDNYEKLISLYAELGVATLSKYLGSQRTLRLKEMGQDINSYSLAEVLVAEKGIDYLASADMRADLLSTFDKETIKKSFPIPDSTVNPIDYIVNFKWGNNEQTKQYLKFLELSIDYLRDGIITNQPEEIISINNSLHSYQNWLRKKINIFLNDRSKKRTIIHMPTGSGKTRTCMESICDFIRQQENSNFTIVWFAHSEELCEQAIQSFEKLWNRYGSENLRIMRLWGGNIFSDLIVDQPTFVVTSFQTAYQLLKTPIQNRFTLFAKIKSNCRLLIVDEAHQSTAPTYKDAIELFSKRDTKIIGLTATPGRHHFNSDPASTIELSEFYENNKINIVDDDGNELLNPIQHLIENGILSRVEHYSLPSNTEITLSDAEKNHIEKLLDIPQSVLKKLGEDAIRTNLVVTYALKLAIENKLPTIIFAPSKENAIEISTILRLRGCKSKSITSDTNRDERRVAIQQYKNNELMILTNYGVLTTGFDAPNTKAVIIARPTTSVVLYSQMIGRGLRGPRMGGNPICHLIDVIDNIHNMPDVSDAFKYFDEYYTT